MRALRTYIQPTSEFVAVERTQPSKLKFLTRSGALAREIDLAPIGIESISALTYFNPLHPSGGQFMVFDFARRVHAGVGGLEPEALANGS